MTEALARRDTVLQLLIGDEALARHADLVAAATAAAVPVAVAGHAILAELADTVTPQGVLAVCRSVHVPIDDALAGTPRLVVLCHRVRDPGNLGTVIRCADAFGADAVLVSSASVDVYNPKTVRASTGSVFHLPVAVEVELADAVAKARGAGLQILGADGSAPTSVVELAAAGALRQPTLWVLGNEAWGLPADDVALLDRLVALPMYGHADSLNLSTAAAVVLYASATAQRA